MVVFNKIYIKIGDVGEIVFGNGSCVVKYLLWVNVYGIVDEINVIVGLVWLYVIGEMDEWLVVI